MTQWGAMSGTTYPKSPVDHCTFHTLGSSWVFHYNINYQWLKRGYPVCSWECYAQFLLVASLMQGLFAKQASGKIPRESSPKDVPSGHRKWLAGTSTIVHHLQMIFSNPDLHLYGCSHENLKICSWRSHWNLRFERTFRYPWPEDTSHDHQKSGVHQPSVMTISPETLGQSEGRLLTHHLLKCPALSGVSSLKSSVYGRAKSVRWVLSSGLLEILGFGFTRLYIVIHNYIYIYVYM